MTDLLLPVTKPGPKQRQRPKRPGKARKPLAIRTLSQFPQAAQPELKAQKFTHPDKSYRLIWVWGNRFWLCGEDTTKYQKVHGPGGVIEAGKALAEKLGEKFKE